MKKIIFLLLISNLIYSQNNLYFFTNDTFTNQENKAIFTLNNFESQKKNLIKLNFPLIHQPALSLQYERNINKKISAGLAFSYTGEREFLFLKLFREKEIDNNFVNNQLEKIKSKSWSVTPEVKFYFGKDAFTGFYIAPFIRYTKYDIKFPLDYLEEEINNHYQQVNFTGKSNTITYGVSIGAQWKIYKDFYIDWLIVGPHFGKGTEKLRLNSDLSQTQQDAIIKSLEIIKSNYNEIDGYPKVDFDYSVNNKGGEIRIRNPWGGVRLELGIGYRF